MPKLMAKGADVNARDSRGDSLLGRALFRQRWELAEALLDAGASTRSPDASSTSRAARSIAVARSGARSSIRRSAKNESGRKCSWASSASGFKCAFESGGRWYGRLASSPISTTPST